MICQHPQGVSSAKITIGFPALAANMATRSNAARTVRRTRKCATMITYHGYILMYSLASEKHDQPRSQHRCVVIACVTSGCMCHQWMRARGHSDHPSESHPRHTRRRNCARCRSEYPRGVHMLHAARNDLSHVSVHQCAKAAWA